MTTPKNSKTEFREFMEQLAAELNRPEELAQYKREIEEGRAFIRQWHHKHRQAIIDAMLKAATDRADD